MSGIIPIRSAIAMGVRVIVLDIVQVLVLTLAKVFVMVVEILPLLIDY